MSVVIHAAMVLMWKEIIERYPIIRGMIIGAPLVTPILLRELPVQNLVTVIILHLTVAILSQAIHHIATALHPIQHTIHRLIIIPVCIALPHSTVAPTVYRHIQHQVSTQAQLIHLQ